MILDTNALSAWAENDPRLLAILPRDRPWRLPLIVVGEFRYGIRRSRERVALEAWLAQVVGFCELLTLDLETTEAYGALREELRAAATPIPENDVWIAALCRQYLMPLASRDRHFDLVRGLVRKGW